jgi:vacuolar-type H+-ATPase subunit H
LKRAAYTSANTNLHRKQRNRRSTADIGTPMLVFASFSIVYVQSSTFFYKAYKYEYDISASLRGETPMSRADTLVKIKEAESKARETIAAAEEKQKAISAGARREAIRLMQEAEDKMKAEHEAAMAKEKQAMSEKKQQLLKKGSEEADKLMSKAAANVPKAKARVKEVFERTIDASA